MDKKIDLQKARKFAEKLSIKVGKFLLNNQDKIKITKYKDRQDIQTNIDLQAEKIFIEAIQKKYPSHNIVSEEIRPIDRGGKYSWFIDPLDGTKEYTRGLPTYNVCLSLETERETLLGVVYIPRTNELYSCVKGAGAFENGKKIRVSNQNKLENSFIYTRIPTYRVVDEKFKKMWDSLGRIVRSSYRLRSHQADVICLCWLAKGALEGHVLLVEDEKWIDVSAGILMVQEAGGKVTDRFGKPITSRDLTKGIVASNGKIHDQLIKILR